MHPAHVLLVTALINSLALGFGAISFAQVGFPSWHRVVPLVKFVDSIVWCRNANSCCLHSCSFETFDCCEALKGHFCYQQDVPGGREAPLAPGTLRPKPGKQCVHSVCEDFPLTSLNMLFRGLAVLHFWSACFATWVLCCLEAVCFSS